MKKVAFLITCAALALSGCANIETGHDFDLACVNTFQPGVTTKAEAINCLGEPYSITKGQDPNRELLIWVHSKTSATMFSASGETKGISLIFQDGKFEKGHKQSTSKTSTK